MESKLGRWSLAIVLVVAGCPAALWLWIQLSHAPLPAVRIAGRALNTRGDRLGQLEQRARLWGETRIVVQIGMASVRVTRAQLGAALNAQTALAAARGVGRSGNPLRDLRDYFAARRGQLDVAWEPDIDASVLDAFVEREQARVDRLPVVGVTDGHGNTLAGQDGETLDMEQATATLQDGLRRAAQRIEIALRRLEAPEPLLMGMPDGAWPEEAAEPVRPEPVVPRAPALGARIVEPTHWMPDRQACWQQPRPFCNGPRRVPVPWGADKAQAQALGLGLAAVPRLLGAPPNPAWVRAAGGPLPRQAPLWPVPTGRFVRGFGLVRKGALRDVPHNGVDISAPLETVILAAQDGVVAYADNQIRGYGNLLMIVHPDGAVSLSAHCERILVFAGQRVRRGEPVARIGATGLALGPHVHFEYRQDGQLVNPDARFVGRPASQRRSVR